MPEKCKNKQTWSSKFHGAQLGNQLLKPHTAHGRPPKATQRKQQQQPMPADARATGSCQWKLCPIGRNGRGGAGSLSRRRGPRPESVGPPGLARAGPLRPPGVAGWNRQRRINQACHGNGPGARARAGPCRRSWPAPLPVAARHFRAGIMMLPQGLGRRARMHAMTVRDGPCGVHTKRHWHVPQ
jgi:hypothetical protein